MTKPDITAVPTLAGRELDAAVHEFVMGQEVAIGVMHHGPDWVIVETIPWVIVTHYSRDRDPSLFDVLEKMREDGWAMQIDHWPSSTSINLIPIKDDDLDDTRRPVRGIGSTLNEALARAALLTTYPPKEATDAR